MPDSNEEVLNAAAQARFGLDLNGALRAATGLALDANGISKFLFGAKDLNANHAGMLSLLTGGVLLDGTSNSYIETSDKAALDLAGDMDIRVEFVYTSTTFANGVLLAKWTPGTQQSYQLFLIPVLTTQQLITSSTGANSVTNQLNAATGRAASLKATLDADNGASGRTARFFSASSLDGTYTELAGSPVTTAGVTTVFNSTSVLRLGAFGDGTGGFVGRIHRAELRSSIDGTVVANPDLRNVARGATSFVDGAGNTWNVGSAAQVV